MRLARGSGLEGLTAMAPRQRVGRLTVLRPLLGFDKAQLVATCAAARQPWIEDPSNADDRHARVRFRRARAFLAAEGLTDRRLLSTIGHLSRAQAAIDASVETLRLSSTARDEFGVFTLSVAALLAAPEDVALRLLARVLAEAGGSAYAPRYESLAQLDARLRRGENFTATVAGCIVNRSSGVVRLAREPAAIDGEVAIGPGDSVVWDGRFRLTRRAAATATQAPMTVAALRNEHWIRIKALPGARPLVDLPARVRLTLPVICRRETLIGVPHAQLWFDDETRDAVTVAWSAHPADDPITGIERE
jgi:tRNA(Ile)-lysidine synthase